MGNKYIIDLTKNLNPVIQERMCKQKLRHKNSVEKIEIELDVREQVGEMFKEGRRQQFHKSGKVEMSMVHEQNMIHPWSR